MAAEPEGDLRGRFVLMNEDDGQIVGTLDSSVRVNEDPSLAERGHEGDPVVVELQEGTDTLEELSDVEVLVRTIPPEERDWMLKGAVFVRHVLSLSPTLSLTLRVYRTLDAIHKYPKQYCGFAEAKHTILIFEHRPTALARAPHPAVFNNPKTP